MIHIFMVDFPASHVSFRRGINKKVPRFEMSTMFHHEVDDFGQGSGYDLQLLFLPEIMEVENGSLND